MTKGLQLAKSALVGVLLAFSACITAPYDGQTVDGGPISITGYTDVPNASLRFEMYNFVTSQYQTVTPTAVSVASSPSIYAGAWANSPWLYSYSAILPGWVTKIQDGRTAYWESNHAMLRIYRDGASNMLYGGAETSVNCMVASPRDVNFYDTAYLCGFYMTEVDVYANVIF